MVTYRNTKTGRLLDRPSEDEWLEASPGWERVDAPAPAEPRLDEDDLAVPAVEDDEERTDD